MIVRRWDPFREMRLMHENVSQIRPGFPIGKNGYSKSVGWAIPLDVVQNGENIVVHAAMPGIDPSALSVTIDKDLLTIRGQTASKDESQEGTYLRREMHSGSFYRSLKLPDSLDVDNAHSSYDQGVLTISLPKHESRQARQLPVTIVSDSAGDEASHE